MKVTIQYYVICILMTSSFFIGCTDKQKTPTQNKADQYIREVCDSGYVFVDQSCVLDVNQDQDRDGIPDLVDNCISISNANQFDCDYDGEGDVCDSNQQCSASLNGFVQYFEIGETAALNFPYPKLEMISTPISVTGTDIGQYFIPAFPVGEHQINYDL